MRSIKISVLICVLILIFTFDSEGAQTEGHALNFDGGYVYLVTRDSLDLFRNGLIAEADTFSKDHVPNIHTISEEVFSRRQNVGSLYVIRNEDGTFDFDIHYKGGFLNAIYNAPSPIVVKNNVAPINPKPIIEKRKVTIMTIFTMIYNTYMSTLPFIIYIWIFGWSMTALLEILNYGKSYITDNKNHESWLYEIQENVPFKYIYKDDTNEFWCDQFLVRSVVIWGIVLFLWPIVIAVSTFVGTLRGLRWACRTRKLIDEVKDRCDTNHQ